MSGSRWWRKDLILPQALYTISQVIFEGCVRLFVAPPCLHDTTSFLRPSKKNIRKNWRYFYGFSTLTFHIKFYIKYIWIKLTATSILTQPPKTTCEMAEIAWASIGYFLHHLNPDVRISRRPERLHFKILKKKQSIFIIIIMSCRPKLQDWSLIRCCLVSCQEHLFVGGVLSFFRGVVGVLYRASRLD